MHPAALERMPADLPRPHFVQPYWFGHKAFKETGFNLRGLPPLVPTDYLEPPPLGTPERKAWAIYHRAAPGPERAAFRSATLPGVAAACAMQWGDYAAQALAA